jgi:hypothetical protein
MAMGGNPRFSAVGRGDLSVSNGPLALVEYSVSDFRALTTLKKLTPKC